MMGELFFFGGIAGICVFSLAGVIAWAVLRKRKRKLLEAIETEYR